VIVLNGITAAWRIDGLNASSRTPSDGLGCPVNRLRLQRTSGFRDFVLKCRLYELLARGVQIDAQCLILVEQFGNQFLQDGSLGTRRSG